MKLFYIINGLGPGGAERSLAELLPFYREQDVEPVIICLRRRKQGVESDVRLAGCEVRFTSGEGIPAAARAVRRMIRAERPDLIHTTLFESDIAGRLAAIGTGVPVLSSLVNTGYDPARLQDPNVHRLRLRVVQAVDGWTSRHLTAHFHAITHAVKESGVRTMGIEPDRITVIERGRASQRLGVPGAERRLAARQALGLSSEDDVLISVGRQEYQKGHRYLLEAMKTLLRTRPRAVLLVVGREGHASAELHRLHAESGLGHRVRFLGYRADVPEVLAAGDVFLFPSLYEGLGGAVIEAMALGLPIVASALPALREVVEDGSNGILVEPASPAALAAATAELLGDRSRAAEFGRRSMAIFHERFTIERSAARMIRLYRELTGTRRLMDVQMAS